MYLFIQVRTGNKYVPCLGYTGVRGPLVGVLGKSLSTTKKKYELHT